MDACLGSPLHNTVVHFLRGWSDFAWWSVPVFLTVLRCSGSFWSLGHWTPFSTWSEFLVFRLWDCPHLGGSPVSHIWWTSFLEYPCGILFLFVFCVCSSSSILVMAVPYSNRSALCTIPELCLRGKPHVTEAELRRSFQAVANPLKSAFACIQLLSANEIRFCFTSPRKMEDVINTGLSFRGHPLTLGPIHSKKWVTIRRLAYGTPVEFVRKALAPYGETSTVRPEIIDSVATGTLFAHIDLTKDIPSRVRIRGHNCVIWYRDQPRTCFLCGQHGHERRHCPQQPGRRQMVPQQSSREPATPPRRSPPTPSVSPARSPSGPQHHDPPQLRRLATAVASALTKGPLPTSCTVTPGRTYAAVTMLGPSAPTAVTPLEPSTSAPSQFSVRLPKEQPQSQRRRKRPKRSRKTKPARKSSRGTANASQAPQQELPDENPAGSNPPPKTEAPPAMEASLATDATEVAPSPSGDMDRDITPPRVQTPSRETNNNGQTSASAESQKDFLPAPREGSKEDSPQAIAQGVAVSDGEPPSKKSRPSSGPAPQLVTTTPEVEVAFLPLTSGVEAPFGLPPVQVEIHSTGKQGPTFPSLPQGPPSQSAPASPPAPTGPSGPRKTRRVSWRPQIGAFDPFTRRKTKPRPVVGTDRRLLTAQRTKLPPPKKSPPPQQVDYDSDAEYSSASEEESVGLTASGNLRLPASPALVSRIPNPPYQGSGPQTTQQ